MERYKRELETTIEKVFMDQDRLRKNIVAMEKVQSNGDTLIKRYMKDLNSMEDDIIKHRKEINTTEDKVVKKTRERMELSNHGSNIAGKILTVIRANQV